MSMTAPARPVNLPSYIDRRPRLTSLRSNAVPSPGVSVPVTAAASVVVPVPDMTPLVHVNVVETVRSPGPVSRPELLTVSVLTCDVVSGSVSVSDDP